MTISAAANSVRRVAIRDSITVVCQYADSGIFSLVLRLLQSPFASSSDGSDLQAQRRVGPGALSVGAFSRPPSAIRASCLGTTVAMALPSRFLAIVPPKRLALLASPWLMARSFSLRVERVVVFLTLLNVAAL